MQFGAYDIIQCLLMYTTDTLHEKQNETWKNTRLNKINS